MQNKDNTILKESDNDVLCLFCMGTKITRDLLLRPETCRHCFKELKFKTHVCVSSKTDCMYSDE